MITYTCEDIEELRIYQQLKDTVSDSLPDVHKESIRNLGLKKTARISEKGRRTLRTYDNELEEVVIKDVYEYVMAGKKIKSYTRKLEWLKIDGSVGITKTIDEEVASGKIIELNIQVRKNQINYLREKGEDLRLEAESLPSPYKEQYIQVADMVDSLFVHYENEIVHYEKLGSTEFEDAVNNESDASVQGILSIPVNDEGETVKQLIIDQIT